jgi:hypothetical protein
MGSFMDYVNSYLKDRNIKEGKLGWTFWGSWGVGVLVGMKVAVGVG